MTPDQVRSRTQASRSGDARRRRGSLVVKLLVVALVCLIANGLFIAIYFPSRYENEAMVTLRTKISTLEQVVAASLVPALDFDDIEGARAPLAGLREVPEVLEARVLNEQSAVIAHYVRGEALEAAPDPAVKVTASGKGDILQQSFSAPGGRPVGRLEIIYSTDLVHDEARRYRNTILFVTLLLVFANGLAITVVSRRIVRPLLRLTEAARKLSGGEF